MHTGSHSTPAAQSSLRVLVIEDDPHLARLVESSLSQHTPSRFEVQSAGTLADGLRRLGEAHFDAAVLDLGLPDSRGTATVEAVRTHFPLLPIVVLSGAGDEETLHEALRAGAQDYIAKGSDVLAILPRSVLFAVDRKQGEDALRRSEEKYREMVESINDVIFTLDTHGVIGYVSPVVQSALGYDPAQLVGHAFRGLIHPDDLDAVNKAFADALENRLFVSEFRMRDQSGDVRWVRTSSRPMREHGKVTGIRGVLTDITARKRSEAGLRAIEAKYRSIVETAAEGVWVFDELGRTILVNRQMAAMLGYAVAEMTGRTFESYLFPEDRKRRGPSLSERSRRKFGAFEQRLPKKDGGTLWTLISTGQIVGDDGRDLGFFAMLTDITERRQAEDALRDVTIRLRETFDNMSDGVAVYEAADDGRDFVIVDINGTGQKLSVVRHDEVVGKRITEVFPAVGKGGLLDVMRQVWRTGIPQHHPLVLYDDGRIRQWVENYVFKLPSGRILALYSDTSVLRAAEKELRASESRFHSLFDHAMDGMLLTWPDGRILHANRAACRMFGRSEKELVRGGRDAVVDTGDVRVKAFLAERTRRGRAQGELTCVRKDGTRFPAYVSSAVFTTQDGEEQSAMIIHDLSCRRQVEEQVSLLSARFAAVQDDERKRISQELHDRVGQTLTALSINLAAEREARDAVKDRPALKRLNECLQLTNDLGRHVEDVMAELHPPVLDDDGITAALKRYAQESHRRLIRTP